MSRIDRLEIPKAIKLEVWKRAGGLEDLRCEGCGRSLRGETPHYDHRKPEWLQNTPKSERTITAEDVQLLGWKCCHKPKTAAEATTRAHSDRIIERAAGIKRRKGRPLNGTKESGWKKPFYDNAYRREET